MEEKSRYLGMVGVPVSHCRSAEKKCEVICHENMVYERKIGMLSTLMIS